MWNRIDTLIVWLLATVLVGVTIHTPVTVWLETQFPHLELLVKSWKEMVLGVVAVLLFMTVWRRGLLRDVLLDKYIVLIGCIGALHLLLVLVFDNSYVSEMAGLLIDLRFYLFFAEVYVASRVVRGVRSTLIGAASVGAAIVVLFGVLQVSVLPRDVLSHIGYSDATIKPYLTVDLNYDYVRINSTLRGPNPVGAFAVTVLSLAGAWWLRRRGELTGWQDSGLLVLLGIGASTILIASYSRSAWVAAVVAACLLAVIMLPRRYLAHAAAGVVLLGLCTGSLLFALRDTHVVSNLFFHNNPASSSVEKSDDGHLSSLQGGVAAAEESPIGHGVGSAGSASLHGDSPVVIENQYLFMAHESGWLGLVLQLWLFVVVLPGLWRGRTDWLALGVFAAGIGLAIIGILLPVWADDTVSLYWWGLAGLALGSSAIIKPHGKNSAKRKSHQKAARAT